MPFLPPLDKALQQIAIGAAYVQKVAVVGDGIEDQFPFRAPPLVAAAKSRLPDGIRLPQVRPLQRSETVQELQQEVPSCPFSSCGLLLPNNLLSDKYVAISNIA